MISTIARTQIYNHTVSTVYVPRGGEKGAGIYETIIICNDSQAISRVLETFYTFDAKKGKALQSHADAVYLARYILDGL